MPDSFNLSPLIVGGTAGILSAVGLWAYSVFAPRCQFWAPVIRSLPQREGVALTFEDGPHPEFTPRILDTLAARQVKAAFFVIGKHAAAHPNLVKRIHDEGHDIGNHTFDHAPFRLRDQRYWERQISRTQETVAAIVGSPPLLFRPPGGYKTRSLAAAASAAGLPIIGWSVRAKEGPAEVVGGNLARRTSGYDIVLLNDGAPPYAPISRQYVVDALPNYLRAIVEKKLKIVPLVSTLVAASADIRAGAERNKAKAESS